jgi:hypothetical protein
MVADEVTLTRLAGLAQNGDQQAYGALLAAARLWLLRYFRRKLPPEQIEDLAQDTLLTVHRKLASYDPARPFTPWLATGLLIICAQPIAMPLKLSTRMTLTWRRMKNLRPSPA